MNKFSAGHLLSAMRSLDLIRSDLPKNNMGAVVSNASKLQETCDHMAAMFGKLSLTSSVKAAVRFKEALSKEITALALVTRLEALQETVEDELRGHLFFWVPPHRSEWYEKEAESIIGIECCSRFPSIQRELEESARCYALGRFTASAFHLTRATEAGVKALAKAINYIPKNNNWTLVFRKIGDEFAFVQRERDKTKWPLHWQTHRDFLEEATADLRAVAKAWRNDIAHLVDCYQEEEAKSLLDVIPVFLKHLASKMDENGTLY